ncbi:MAG: hypothetical protein M1834_003682 [Cirrosporium novae-zelandiae]|nr:MAG: hypothetical protein M1834_003682 [Cirrosporium novae-zelandiae]
MSEWQIFRYHCDHCNCDDERLVSPFVFIDNVTCRNCGVSVGDSREMLQDDLVAEFSSKMMLDSSNPTLTSNSTQSVPPQQQQQQQQQEEQPIVFISQHYNHSAHLVASHANKASTTENHRSEEEMVVTEQNSDMDMIGSGPESVSSETTMEEVRTPEHKSTGDGAHVWNGMEDTNGAEPYMCSLYETWAPNQPDYTMDRSYNPATDPVYQKGQQWWRHGSDKRPIEHQYGTYMALSGQ